MGATLEIQRQQRVEQLEQQLAWAQFQQRPVERVSGYFNKCYGIPKISTCAETCSY